VTTMKHPDSPDPIEVESGSVALYTASGWVVTDAEPVKAAPKRRRRPVTKK